MQIKLAWNDKLSQIDDFFWKMWKELFDIDCYNQIEAYKKCEIYYMQNDNKIISAIIFTNYKWKNYIWRFWTLAEYRNNWYWSSLIKTILNKYDDIYLEADEKQVNYDLSKLEKIKLFEIQFLIEWFWKSKKFIYPAGIKSENSFKSF